VVPCSVIGLAQLLGGDIDAFLLLRDHQVVDQRDHDHEQQATIARLKKEKIVCPVPISPIWPR
jgi:hypothetical protein